MKPRSDWWFFGRMLAATAGTVAVIVGGAVAWDDYSEAKVRAEARVQALREFTDITSTHLWEFDYAAVRSVAQSFLQREDIVGLKIVDRYTFEVFDRSTQESKGDKRESLSAKIYSPRDGGKARTMIGEAMMTVQGPTEIGIFLRALRDGVGAFFAVFLPCSLVFLLYLRRYVSKPLDRLHQAIEHTQTTGKHATTDYEGLSMFGYLAAQFNRMQASMEQNRRARELLLEQRNAAAEELESSLKELQKETLRRREKAGIVRDVLKAIQQSVSYFDEDGGLLASNVGSSTPLELRSIFSHRFVSVVEMRGVAVEKGLRFQEVLPSDRSRGRSSTSGLVFAAEVETPAGRIWTVQAADLGRGRSALVSTDVTNLRRVERQLMQNQKMEALGSLTAGVAHDFNNLLAIILLNLETIRRVSVHQPKIEVACTAIRAATDRAISVVNALLTYSRSEPARTSFVALDEVFDQLGIVLPTTLGPQIQVTFHVHTQKEVRVDREHLALSLLNLAVNARDAMPEGGSISISVRLAHQSEIRAAGLRGPGEYLALEVSDTGEGIPAEVVDRIFEPFFTTKPRGEGTGLGLAVVYGFAQQSSGAVTCDSTAGVGTCFRIFIPVAQGKEQKKESLERLERPDLAGLRLLLVDDEPLLLSAMKLHLSEHGVFPEMADSVASALEVFEQPEARSLEAIVCDVYLADGLGLDVARKAREVNSKIVVILVSGNIDLGVRRKEAEGLFDVFLEKPFEMETLIQELHHRTRGTSATDC